MPSPARRESRRSKRAELKRRASLIINLNRIPKKLPCIVLDSSNEGFRVRGNFNLRRDQVVELILDEETPMPQRCSVVWGGRVGSKQEGEAGVEIV